MVSSILSNTTAASALWKQTPVSVKAATHAPTPLQTKTNPVGHVSVSPLSKALTGVAADMFSLLDKDLRSTIENIVSSGVMSARDVADGLRQIAAQGCASATRASARATPRIWR